MFFSYLRHKDLQTRDPRLRLVSSVLRRLNNFHATVSRLFYIRQANLTFQKPFRGVSTFSYLISARIALERALVQVLRGRPLKLIRLLNHLFLVLLEVPHALFFVLNIRKIDISHIIPIISLFLLKNRLISVHFREAIQEVLFLVVFRRLVFSVLFYGLGEKSYCAGPVSSDSASPP